MVLWFNKWQEWLDRRQLATAPQSSSEFWTLPDRHSLEWDTAESDALLEHERTNRFCSICDEATGESHQTVVLGFDLHSNQLLLDDFFPRPAQLAIGQPLVLNLPTIRGLLSLSLVVQDPIIVTTTPAWVVGITQKQWLRDRRLAPRVDFNTRCAPKVEMLIPLTPTLRGQLIDLSAGGFSMSSVSPQKPELLGRNGTCRIHFDDHFVLDTDIRLQQVRFHRWPSRHTLFRARFRRLSATERARLQAFLHSYTTLTS